MSGRLEGRIAAVTGAAQGIGLGLAQRLAQEGCCVALADMNGEKASVAAGEIDATGSRTFGLGMDVTQAADADRLVQSVIDRWGRLDILVNNAGIIRAAPFYDLSEEDWDAVLAVNLKGVYLCSRAAARVMMKQLSGSIINIASKSAKTGGLWLGAYCASKFGAIGLTQSMAQDMALYGVRVNAVCPGNVFATAMWDRLDKIYSKKLGIPPEQVRARYIEKVPLGRECRVEDVANVVVFLASDEASYMTGQSINVTGGQEMR